MTVAIVALALALLVIILALLVLIGAHREAPLSLLDAEPPTRLAGFARAVLGVYVCKDVSTESTHISPTRQRTGVTS